MIQLTLANMELYYLREVSNLLYNLGEIVLSNSCRIQLLPSAVLPLAHHTLYQPSTMLTVSSFHQKFICIQHLMNLVTLLKN